MRQGRHTLIRSRTWPFTSLNTLSTREKTHLAVQAHRLLSIESLKTNIQIKVHKLCNIAHIEKYIQTTACNLPVYSRKILKAISAKSRKIAVSKYKRTTEKYLEMRGIDPRTSRMLSGRSTIWATPPEFPLCLLVLYRHVNTLVEFLLHLLRWKNTREHNIDSSYNEHCSDLEPGIVSTWFQAKVFLRLKNEN